MTPALYHLGRFCVRHPFVVIALWVVVLVGVVGTAKSVGQNTNDDLTLPGTGSQAATNLLSNKFPDQANGSVPIAFKAPKGSKITDDKYKKPIKAVTKAYSKDKAISSAIGPFDKNGSDQLNKKKTIGYISLNIKDSSSELNLEEAKRIIRVDQPLAKAGLEPAAGGYLGKKVSKPSTHFSEVSGLLAAVVILLFTFGTFVAMGLPILTAISGLAVGMGAITILSNIIEVPTSAPALATMIGLGVGIDYALFIVTRHRSHLAGGMESHESVARATATAGGAVVFAGGTVIIALLSLGAAGIPIVTTLGFTATLVVLTAALGAISLLPAVLGLLGHRINWLRLPGMSIHHDERPHGWARWAAFVGSHPWSAMIAGFLVLLVIASPVRQLHLGQADNGAMPKSTQLRQSYDLMSQGFGVGSNGPILIAVNLTKPAHNDQADLNKLQKQQQQQLQQKIDQETKKQQKKADKQIQQQAQQKTAQTNKEIQQQAQEQQEKSDKQIDQQFQQLRDQLGPRAPQDAIDNAEDQQKQQANQQIQQQAQQTQKQKDKEIQQQAQQTQKQKNKEIAKQVKKQVTKQYNSSAQAAQVAQQEKFLKSKSSDPRLTNLRNKMKKAKNVDSVTYALVNKKGNAAVYTVTPKTSPSSQATEDLVHTLRDHVIPRATKGKQMSADVGGSTASYIDLAAEISEKLPLVIGIVLVLSFLILLVAFRSVLVPLKAVVMNTFSILAAFGVVTYFFDHDWTAKLIGLEGSVPIVSFVPLMMFAVLFGLSMDYEVFLMTHIREHWKESGDPREAVVHGLASTARVITSAALIMVSVFLAFVVNGDPTIKQFGLGMAVAVGVDATVVRCLLVPAIMSVLGHAGWWMPTWLDKATPAFSIEGDEFFASLEAKEAAQTTDEQPAAEEPTPEPEKSREAEEAGKPGEPFSEKAGESEKPDKPPVVG